MASFLMISEIIGFLKWLFEQISSHRYEKPDYAGGKEHEQDVASENDAIKTDIFEVDILGKLLHKGIPHGQGLFRVLFL